MSEKRFTEEYDEEWGIYLSDNLTGDWYNINPAYIVDTCNKLWEQVIKLREENEQLRQDLKSLETTSNATSDYNAHLEGKIISLNELISIIAMAVSGEKHNTVKEIVRQQIYYFDCYDETNNEFLKLSEWFENFYGERWDDE